MLLPVKVPSKVIYVITDMQKLSWEQFVRRAREDGKRREEREA